MSDHRLDYDDPAIEETWCEERRADVADYLGREEVAHGRIGEWPAWHVAPYVSVWAIESAQTPDAIGWWVISGDLPTDYVSSHDAKDPRQALLFFAARWRKAAEEMAEGRAPPDCQIGRTSNERQSLAPLLSARAGLLAEFADDDDIWSGVLDD